VVRGLSNFEFAHVDDTTLEITVFEEEVLVVRLLDAQAAEVQTLDDQRSRNVSCCG
jgi:hypothetical protein